MEKMSSQSNKISLLAKVFCLFALVAAVCALFPAHAFAADGNIVAYSGEGSARTYYTSIEEAMQAGYSGKTIYMARDWEVTSKVKIPGGKTLTIDMNGHALRMTKSNTDEAIIVMEEGSNLTLQSATNSTFTYEGYDAESGKKQTRTIQTGGLVTGGNTNYAGGVRMIGSSTLTLDNVAIAGNQGRIVGGLEIKKNCTLNMKNGASIEACRGEYGGVSVDGDDATINMDNSKISDNYASGSGGGVYSAASATRIHMTNNAAISGNYAGKSGGGVYFDYSYFGIYSSDKTGMITDNHATDYGDYGLGGGIYVAYCRWHTCEGTLQGINVINNYSRYGGGGIYLNQNWTRVIDCTVRGNQSYNAGGGVYLSANNVSLESCTITDNVCDGSKEGGGVFVDSEHDVKIIGKTTIINNTRGKDGSKDDLFLEDTPFTSAYITGGVDEGSKVGVRLSQDGERRFGKNITTYTDNTYFIDLEGYEVSHGTDAGGDLWQRKTADKKYTLNFGGTVLGQYKYDEAITVNGSSTDGDKAFWYWDAGNATGLVPISDYINDENKYDPVLSFAMPQNDVFVSAVYADAVTSGKFTVEKPVPGQDLPTEATFQRTDSGAGPSSEIPELAVTWYEVDANGNKTQATGKAKYDTTYVAEFSIRNQQYNGVAFSSSIVANDIDVYMSSDRSSAASASVTADTGVFTVESWQYTTPKPAVKAIAKTYMIAPVGTSSRELTTMLPSKATVHLEDGSSVVVDTDTSGRINWPDGLLDSSGHVKNPEGSTVLLNMELPLKENSAVPGIEKQTVTVEITVNSAGVVGTPQLSPAGGVSTYNKYSGETRLDDNLVLTVNASCITTGASVKYKVKNDDGTWGDAQLANNGEIRLQGKSNELVQRDIVVWAEKAVGGTTLTSQEVTGTYYLDDTVNKEITISCTDTGSYDGTTPWTKSFTATGDLGMKATITAPAQDGRIFSHWEWDGAPEGTDLNSSTLTIRSYSQDLSGKIKAVYIPVISSIDLGIDAPVAHKALAEGAGSVEVTVGSDKATYEIADCFADGAKLSWSPTAESDGTAAHGTAYSAYLKWNAGEGSAEYALSDDVKLLLNGQTVEGATVYESATESGRMLGVAFPATSGLKVSSVASLSDVDLPYEDACAYQDTADAGRTASWGLPNQVQVTYACGETGLADVEWGNVEGFQKNLSAQTLTATGTVGYPSNVDTTDAPKTITATINVAAAEKAAAPTATPEAGTYGSAQQVELECATPGVTIRYTTDGSEPTEESTEYEGNPFTVSDTTTVKARAYRDGMIASDVAEFAYGIEHTVTFDTAGGSAVESQQVVGGQCATQPEAPTMAGFKFEYWADADGNKYGFSAAVHSDITLYAHWTASADPVTACLVTFNSAGGTAVASQTVANGGKAERPADPALDGFTFQGWGLADGTAYDFSAPVTSDVKLYASWSAASPEPIVPCTVTFDSAGGSAVASQIVANGFAADEPSAPVLEGFTFDCWSDADGNKYDFAATPVTSDIVLYAHWRKSVEPVPACTVVFDSAGGSTVGAQTVASGDAASRPADPTRDGFAFEGWYLEDGAAYDFSAPVTSSLRLYAHWSATPEPVSAYTVTFDSAGGSDVPSQTVAAGGTASEPAAPTWDGYTFQGWFTEGGEAYSFAKAVTSDVALYAHWTKSGEASTAHIVVFDSAGGSAVAAQTITDGDAAVRPEAPTWKGHTFEGWFTESGEAAYDFATPVTSNLVLYAHWSATPEPVSSHTVAFDSAGGSDVPSQTVADGGFAAEPAAPTRDGFTFEYWADADGSRYSFAATPVTSDVTLYAHWTKSVEPVPAYLVVFDSAGGSAVDAQTVVKGGTVAEPAAPTWDGYTFQGWFAEDGEPYDFTKAVTSDLKLCAHWSKGGEPVSAYTVTFDSAGGSDVPGQTVAAGGTAVRPADPTQEGFTFQYWADANGNEYSFDTPVTSDLTLHAVWAASGEPAPAPSGSEPAAEAAAEAAAADKGASAKTADALPLNAVGAIAAIAAIAALAAAAVRRRKA